MRKSCDVKNRSVDSTVDKVTELQPLILIRAIEDYSPSDTTNAETKYRFNRL
jgi:hypothetical protein